MEMKRRSFLSSSVAVATAALFGLRPDQVLSAEGGTLRLAMSSDLGSLDPGYFTSLPAEIGTLFCCMPSLARPRQDANGTWGWEKVRSIGICPSPPVRWRLASMKASSSPRRAIESPACMYPTMTSLDLK